MTVKVSDHYDAFNTTSFAVAVLVVAGSTSCAVLAVDVDRLFDLPCESVPHVFCGMADSQRAEKHKSRTRRPHGCGFSLHSVEEKL